MTILPLVDKRTSTTTILRKQAEEKAALSPQNILLLSPEEIQETLHELLVHQIELEMQNEELRQSQTELCATKARYFDLYNLAPVGYCTVSEEGLILEANLTVAKLLGAARLDLVAHSLTGFILKEDQDLYYSHRQQVFKSFKPKTCELRMVKKDGTSFWAGLSATVAQDDNGESVCRVVMQDITGRKQAGDLLLAEKNRLAVTLRSIGDGVVTTDTLGNIVIMNNVAEVLCGWKQDEARGRPLTSVFTIINALSRLPHDNLVADVLATGQCRVPVLQPLCISRDGTERIIAESGAPIKDANNVIIGAVLVFRDMTEQRKMLDNMSRVERLDSLGILAGGIAHDFNNLLAGIFGYLDLAREECAADTNVSMYLDRAVAVFERAKDLTRQLLTFSKGGAPKLKKGNIGTLVMENAAFVLSGTNVGCEYHLAPDLLLCDFDKNQMSRVIDNIVINAQQAMPLGGTIVITVDNLTLENNAHPALTEGKYIRMSIADTGAGIPHNLLTRIFDPFFTTKQKGTGLGLATSYSIIRKHGGCIEVESVQGKGATFHIFLPASPDGTVEDSSQSATQHKGTGSFLVMDDEKFMRDIVGTMLTAMDYTTLEATNGEEALLLCAEMMKKGTPIGGALFDLTIPGGIGGKVAIVELRKDFPDMPVFAYSGFSEDPVMARPAEFGFTDSIRKPFRKNELAQMLNKHFKTQR